jgi:protein associated with RNAse G/E
MPGPAVGSPLAFRWRKWDGSRHWEHECVYLGSDEWGDWVGQPVGSRSFRPGRDMTLRSPSVMMLPAGREDYVLTFNGAPELTRVYIDIAWAVQWPADGLPTAIDMDLDVVRRLDERGVYIDDEDEWDEHRVLYGYPSHVVRELEATTRDLAARVRALAPPFDEATADRWLGALARLDSNA